MRRRDRMLSPQPAMADGQRATSPPGRRIHAVAFALAKPLILGRQLLGTQRNVGREHFMPSPRCSWPRLAGRSGNSLAGRAINPLSADAEKNKKSDTDATVTLSDTLSATTPFASPRGEAPPHIFGAQTPTAPQEATPGFAPPLARAVPPRLPAYRTTQPRRCLGRMPARRAPCPASEIPRPLAARGRGQFDGRCPPSLAIVPADWCSFRPARVHTA